MYYKASIHLCKAKHKDEIKKKQPFLCLKIFAIDNSSINYRPCWETDSILD